MIDLTKIYPSTLTPQEKLLRYLDDVGQTGLLIVRPFAAIEAELELCHNTFKRYLKNFQDAEILKFNLQRNAIMLHPKVFQYSFTTDERYFWNNQYYNFAA